MTRGKSKGKEIAESFSLSPHEAIQSIYDSYINDHHLVASDIYHLPYWLDSPLPNLGYLSQTFPSDESIMEIMSLDEYLWKDSHHRSSFFLMPIR